MTAQDATKSRKNAKERRAKKKEGGSKETTSSRSDKSGGVKSPPKGGMAERVTRFFKGVVAETRRVSWPSKPELIAGTITSFVILLIFAGWLGLLDYILRISLG